MADFAAGLITGGAGQAVPSAPTRFDAPVAGEFLGFGGGGPTVITYFKMRALSTGSGYETWTVTGTPDYAGTFAPGPIQAGTAVVVTTWQV